MLVKQKQKMRRDFFLGKYRKDLALGRSLMYSLRMTNDELLALPNGTFTNFGVFLGVEYRVDTNGDKWPVATFRNLDRGTSKIPFNDKILDMGRTMDNLEVITDERWEWMKQQREEMVKRYLDNLPRNAAL
jgi:hypothetical protein